MSRARITCCLLGFAAVAWLWPAAWVRGDIYRRVDSRGVVHFTNVPSKSTYRLFMKELPPPPPKSSSRRTLRRYETLIEQFARAYGVDVDLVRALIKVESDFDPWAVSSKGAKGLMQLMPETARDLGVRNRLDPVQNVEGGVRHLRFLLDTFRGRLPLALAAYNAGKNAVFEYGRIPPYPETERYVQKVLRYYMKYKNKAR